MTKQDRQKLNILVVLVAVLGLTLVLGYRMNQPATTAAVQPPEPQKTSVNPPAANDARIRLDLVDKSESGDGGVGKKNVFQYQQAPPPPPPILKPVTPPPAVGPRGGGNTSAGSNPISTVPPGPPPPPPPIPLKYQGYAALDRPGGGFTAFVADDSRHYNVSVGEVLMGRYRILGISDKSVEVEDLEFKRRQTLALQK